MLVLDDWGLAAVKDVHRHDLLEMLDDRDGSRSTVITSQLPRERWHDYLGDPTVADAILDRVVHRAHPHCARRTVPTQRAAAVEEGGRRISQAVDAARPMETPERFPQVFGKPHRTRFPTAPTAIHSWVVRTKNERRTKNHGPVCLRRPELVHCQTPKRRFAPITKRGPTDHDGVDWVITMPRTD